LSGASSAQAYIYWSSDGAAAIGRANLDGTSPDQSFITGANEPAGIALDGAHIYWTNYPLHAIGRANLDGTSPDQSFITGATFPYGIAVDAAHVYWTNSGDVTIGRANLDGTSPDQSFITGASQPYGLAVDGAHIYWTDAVNGTIGRANLDGTSPEPSFITGATAPYGVAVDGAHIYWTNAGSNTVGRANLDGTSPDQNFIAGRSQPYGMAVDSAHLYWAHGQATIMSRANLDGTGLDQNFLSGANGLAVAVDALGPPPQGPPPQPIQGTAVNVVPRKGKVLVKLPPRAGNPGGFVPLESLGQQIPVGSTLDTTHGTVRLFAATNGSGRTQHGDFSGGLFNVTQGHKNPLTTLSMTGGGLTSCGKLRPGGSPKLAAARKRKRRHLFSSVKGHFSVRGRNSAATVRGTQFTMTDSCAGTRTQVRTGTVRVRDFWLRKTVTVKAGHSYLARRGNR
jgi:hypothetical protein